MIIIEKIQSLSLPKNARIIVISDIHGELELLQSLLERVNFKSEDYLIINGDLCEKGTNSLAVVSFMKGLSDKNSKVHVIEGNCDTLVENLLEEDPKLLNYITKKENTLLNDCLKYIGVKLDTISNINELKNIVMKEFSNEINWLNELPTAIETDDFIFVHAGLENIPEWRKTTRENALTIPSFLDKGHQANKFIVVGHWPVINYPSEIPSNNPIIDLENKIIAIDGGNIIKETGQLNALIIEKSPQGNRFSHTYTDRFIKSETIKDFQAESQMTGSISYPFFDISPIEEGEDFTQCRQHGTNKKVCVKNEYIKQNKNGEYTVRTDVSCAQISVKKGEIVSILDNTCSGYTLIKKDGLVGWISKNCLKETL